MAATTIDPDAVKCLSGRRWRVASRTTSGQSYTVVKLADGTLQCSCAAAVNGRSCWHLRAVAQAENDQLPARKTVDMAPGLALLMSNPIVVADGAFVLNEQEY